MLLSDCEHDVGMITLHSAWKKLNKVVIGMLHLPALPGAPLNQLKLSKIRDLLLRDVEALDSGGVHGLMIENFGDVPFYPGRVPAQVVAQITAMALEVKRASKLPLGINVLRNDGQSALAVAHAAGADYIRVNVLCGARVTDQGTIQGIAHDLLRERVMLNAQHIRIFADVDVKHSAPLAPRPLKDEVDDLLERALADAVVVSGAGTGKPTDPAKVAEVKRYAGRVPVFIGSGANVATIKELLPHADGFIVGTSLKKGGSPANPVELVRVKELMKRVEEGQ